MKEIIYTKNAPEPIGAYSQAVMVNGVLYLSGQIAAGYLDKDISTQTQHACENITAVLNAAGFKLEDVVKTTCFLTDMEHFGAFNAVYEKFFAHRPARSCVAAKELPKGALAELEVIAVKQEECK